MKLLDIIGKVGGAVVKSIVPGGGLLVGAVNEFLPDGKKLSLDATGSDIATVIDSLPPEQRVQIIEREFDVDVTHIQESNATVRAMLESDTKNPHTTRPYIAKGAFHVVAFVTVITVSVWAFGVLTANSELVDTIMDGWQFILAVIGPLVTLLGAYFGILKQEHKNKLDAATGSSTPSGIAGILSNIIKK